MTKKEKALPKQSNFMIKRIVPLQILLVKMPRKQKGEKMFRCLDCKETFEEPTGIKESYGQVFYYCPHCLSSNYEDVSKLKCEACEDEYVDHLGDKWCYECRIATSQVMQSAIVKATRETGATIATVVNKIEDVVCGKAIGTEVDRTIAKRVMNELVDLAFDRECDIFHALEMIEAWATGTLQ